MRTLDLIDIALHILAAVVAVTVLAAAAAVAGQWLLWAAAGVNALVWPIREAVQRRAKLDPLWARPWTWSLQKHLEAWPPVAAGLATAWAWA